MVAIILCSPVFWRHDRRLKTAATSTRMTYNLEIDFLRFHYSNFLGGLQPSEKYRLAWASRCCRASGGASSARSPWGERESVQTVGARSLAASSAEIPGAERQASGPRGRNQRGSPAPLGGGPTAAALRAPLGPKRPGPRASTIVQAPGPQLASPSPPSRPPAPGNERAAPGERPGCGAPRRARCGGSCVAAGEGTGNCPRGLDDPRGKGARGGGDGRAASVLPGPPAPPPRDSAPH